MIIFINFTYKSFMETEISCAACATPVESPMQAFYYRYEIKLKIFRKY